MTRAPWENILIFFHRSRRSGDALLLPTASELPAADFFGPRSKEKLRSRFLCLEFMVSSGEQSSSMHSRSLLFNIMEGHWHATSCLHRYMWYCVTSPSCQITIIHTGSAPVSSSRALLFAESDKHRAQTLWTFFVSCVETPLTIRAINKTYITFKFNADH